MRARELGPAAVRPGRHDTFGRFHRGDTVKIRGLRGEYRFCYADDGHVVTATVYGGPHSLYRTVALDRLIKRRVRT